MTHLNSVPPETGTTKVAQAIRKFFAPEKWGSLDMTIVARTYGYGYDLAIDAPREV